MANVTIRDMSTPVVFASGTATPTIPAGAQVGDLLLVVSWQVFVSTTTCTAGWDERFDGGTASYGSWHIYSRVYQTGDGNPTITQSGTVRDGGATIFALYNTDNTTPIDVDFTAASFAAPGGAPYTVTLTGITTNTDGALAFFGWGSNDDNYWDYLEAGGATQQLSENPTTGSSWCVATKLMASKGGTGDQSANQTNKGGDIGESLTFAIKPSGVSPVNIGAGGSPVAQTGKVTEELAASVAAQTARAISSPVQSAKLTEELGAEVMAPVVEPLTVTTPEQSAKLSEELSVGVAAQTALEAAASQSAKATEEIAASVETPATLSIDKTETVKASEETSAFLIGDLSVAVAQAARFADYIAQPLSQSFGVSETVTAEIQEAVTEFLEVSGVVETVGLTEDKTVSVATAVTLEAGIASTVKATEDTAASVAAQPTLSIEKSETVQVTEEWTVSAAAPVTLEPNVAATVRLTEVESTIVEGLLPDLNITGVTEMVAATEATATQVIAQLALELAAIDSVAVVEEVGTVLSAVLNLDAQSTDMASISEVIAASVESGEEVAAIRYLYPNGIVLSRCLRVELFHIKK